MKIKAWLGIIMISALIISAGGCSSSGTDATSSSTNDSSDDATASGDSSSDDSSTDTSQYAVSFAESAGTYDPDDVLDNITFDYVIDVDFSENTARLSSGTAQTITGDGVTILTVDTGSVMVAATEYGITVSSSVDAKIRYNLTGTLDGTLSVSSAGDYQLYLGNLSYSRGTAGSSFTVSSRVTSVGLR